MKICQINSYAASGSTGKIAALINENLLKDGFESIICYSQGSETENNRFNYGNKFERLLDGGLTRITGNRYGYAFMQTSKLLSILERENPDVVHIHCPNNYDVNLYKLLSWCGNKKKKVVITQHATFFYTGNCSHHYDCMKWQTGCGNCPDKKTSIKSMIIDSTHKNWLRMKKCMDNIEDLNVISVSPWLYNNSFKSPILKNSSQYVIENGLDIGTFNYKKSNKTRRDILHVTPDFNSVNKGGKYVLELAKLLPQYSFTVVGANGDEVVPDNVKLIKRTNNQTELAGLYSSADLTLLTSKRETFSMVVAESLCCGTPIVGFNAGAPETIALKEYSNFVEYGNVNDLKDGIIKMISANWNNEKIAEDAQLKYSGYVMYEKYKKIYLG